MSDSAPIVYITEHAFLQLLVSGVELYPSKPSKASKKMEAGIGECLGYLFGTQATQGRRPVHRIEFVVPCQRVSERALASVAPHEVAESRIMSILTPFPGLDLLGSFHSHLYNSDDVFRIPDAVEPSGGDHATWNAWWHDDRKGEMGLELILGLKELARAGNMNPKQMGNCIEGRWERFAYALGAWYAERDVSDTETGETLFPVHWLMCPTAFGMTREDFRMIQK